jgi:CubicO group peptidase (beta-lactamase class C family)
MGAPPPTDPELLAQMAERMGPGTRGARALTVSGAFAMTGRDLPWNKPEVRAAELGGANAVTNARSLALLYGAMLAEVDGVRLLDDDTVETARNQRVNGPDACLLLDTTFGLGFMLDSDFNPLLSAGSFGHPGAGGSLAFADPETGIGFGYVMNKMQQNLAGDPRTLTLIKASYDAI